MDDEFYFENPHEWRELSNQNVGLGDGDGAMDASLGKEIMPTVSSYDSVVASIGNSPSEPSGDDFQILASVDRKLNPALVQARKIEPEVIVISPLKQEDLSEPCEIKPLFYYKASNLIKKLELEMLGPEPIPAPEVATILHQYLDNLRVKSTMVFNRHAEKRRAHMKYKIDPPSVLGSIPMPEALVSTVFSPATAQDKICSALKGSRDQIFLCPDFLDTSTASLRHTCMGCLADGYRVHMKFVEDMELLAPQLCKVNLPFKDSEKCEFLAYIESSPNVLQACNYSVNSKSCSAAKGAVKEIYLDLLAQKHNTTPNLAQEKVPGFTYEHVESLDAVVELVEHIGSAVRQSDAEIDRFREKLTKSKPISSKVKPLLSGNFEERIAKLLKRNP